MKIAVCDDNSEYMKNTLSPVINLAAKETETICEISFFTDGNILISEFEKGNGKITGRMMITLAKIPENIKIDENNKSIYAFECSFDFYDVSIGVVLDTKELKALSPIWATEQVPNAEHPDSMWIDFFLKTLAENISDDGSFGVPIYTFLNDSSDFTVTPKR